MSPVWIDVAGADWLDALVDLHASYRAEEGLPANARAREALEPLLRDRSRGMVLVAGEARDALGYAVLTWGWGLESGGREGLLDEVYVAPERRGQGIGGRLVDRVIEAARSAHCRTLFVETERANESARRLYARHGLAEEDSVWMRLNLAESPTRRNQISPSRTWSAATASRPSAR